MVGFVVGFLFALVAISVLNSVQTRKKIASSLAI